MFCLPTELGFLRLLTKIEVMNQCGAVPLSNDEAITFLTNLQCDPAVSRSDEPPGTRSLWLELAAFSRPAPNVWTDAYLAAFAISLRAEFVTFDQGFRSREVGTETQAVEIYMSGPADGNRANLSAAKRTRRRRWFQFSLRTLLIFVVVCAIPCAWLGSKIDRKRKESEAVKAIAALHGTVRYDYQSGALPDGPRTEPFGPRGCEGYWGKTFSAK